jgi:hypothetical protein
MAIPAEPLKQLSVLASGIETVRGQRDDAFVLFIGSGSSVVNDRPVAEELLNEVLLARWGGGLSEDQLAELTIEQRIERFGRHWSNNRYEAARNRKLREIYDRLRPTKGHSDLARLIKDGYAPFVLSSAIDPLLDNALAAVAHQEELLLGLWRVWINGRDSEEEIREVLEGKSKVDLAVVRLCGDFRFSGRDRVVPVTSEQIKRLIEPLRDPLSERLQSSLIIIDYKPFDAFLLDLIPERGGPIFVIGSEKPDQQFEHTLYHRRPDYIIDPSLTFTTIMGVLAEQLGVFKEVRQLTGKEVSKESIERLVETAPEQPADSRLLELIRLEFERGQQQVGKAAPAAPAVGQPLVDLSLVEPGVSVFTLHMDKEQRVSFNVDGVLNYKSDEAQPWRGESPDELNFTMQIMGDDLANAHRLARADDRATWRQKAKREGSRLRKDLLEGYPDLLRRLDMARHAVGNNPENLTLAFSGPRALLGMPYELLYLDDRPLITHHPACRQVSGVTPRHSQHLEAFVRQLRRKKEPLRVLLIASHTGGKISPDQEIAELHALITAQSQGRVDVQVDQLPTDRASLPEAEGVLKNCAYHLVHFAGHGAFEEQTGENSGLLFWKDTKRSAKAVLTARQLNEWLSNSETRLIYLSACVGARMGSEALLRANDYLGVMDAVVQAGVPYCLGYRWYVTDVGSRLFARQFYERLFTQPFAFIPERAVYHARKERYAAAGTDDETWTSPILVAQNLYR